MARRGRALRRADDDGAWKRVLGELLAEFVSFALPDLYPEIDWGREPRFLEQELRPILRQAALDRRVGDMVVQVWLTSGAAQWLLVHVEVQDRHEDDFAERMYLYAAFLHMHYRSRRVRRRSAQPAELLLPFGMIGVAVLTDADATWRPGSFHWGWGDEGIHYRYRTLKLADWRARSAELADDTRPFAWVIHTWLAIQVAGPSLDAQAAARREAGRQLLTARRQGRLSADQTIATYLFMDAVNRLPDPLAETIDRELQLNEEAPMAELLTRWERQGLQRGLEQGLQQGLERGLEQGREQGREQGLERGLEQGREQGLEQGLQRGRAQALSDAVIRLLGKKKIALDATAEARIRNLAGDHLLDLTEAVLDFQDRAALDAWLARQGRTEK